MKSPNGRGVFSALFTHSFFNLLEHDLVNLIAKPVDRAAFLLAFELGLKVLDLEVLVFDDVVELVDLLLCTEQLNWHQRVTALFAVRSEAFSRERSRAALFEVLAGSSSADFVADYGFLDFTMDALECIKLLLQLNNGLIPLVEACRQRNHNVALLQKQLLVSVHLCFVLLDELPLSFNVLKLALVLLPNGFLPFFECRTELRGILYFLSASEHLRVHKADLLFKHFLFLLFK